jgi:predicted helicase
VFHSPGYRERYAEFLRADFPRLPLTSDYELFRELAGMGGVLVGLHASGKGDPRGLSFPVKDGNVIEDVRYQPAQGAEPGRVWINDQQYFEGVPEPAWAFPIGGYLPAQRWLKDRLGRSLDYDGQTEYQRIIWALIETRRLMAEIDASIAAHGGWPLK